jgi:hypothetical protein
MEKIVPVVCEVPPVDGLVVRDTVAEQVQPTDWLMNMMPVGRL